MIQVGYIATMGRLRAIDPAQVKALAASIKEVGLLNPITVYRREIVRNGVPAEGFGLIAGAHRLEACKSLGWHEVPAVVVELSDDERIIAECDENLCGTKLTPAEQAMFTATRKEAYLRIHPETAAGVAGGKVKPGNKITDDNLSSVPDFSRDQAEKTGIDRRTVQRNAERGEKVTPEALALVKGTPLDTGVFLDRLKKIDPANQAEHVRSELDSIPRSPKSQQRQTAASSRIDADVKSRAAKEVAEMLAEHVPGEWWDALKANLYAAGANGIAHEFTNITGQSIMDRRHG